jgi:uncharacterized protein YyaL (SSP411 family)
MAEWRGALDKIYMPDTLWFSLNATLVDLPQALTRKFAEKVNAWVCKGVKCLPPINRLDELIKQL